MEFECGFDDLLATAVRSHLVCISCSALTSSRPVDERCLSASPPAIPRFLSDIVPRAPHSVVRMSLQLVEAGGILGVAFTLQSENTCEPSTQFTNIAGLRWASFKISVDRGLEDVTTVYRPLPDGTNVEYSPVLAVVDTPTKTRPFWTYAWRMPGDLVDTIEGREWTGMKCFAESVYFR